MVKYMRMMARYNIKHKTGAMVTLFLNYHTWGLSRL